MGNGAPHRLRFSLSDLTMKISKTIPAAALALVCVQAGAVRLPNIIGDNMVLQQKSDARLWGWSRPGATVTATPSWTGKAEIAKADKKGRWQLTVPTPEASFTPQTIVIADRESADTVSNVLIGEVWLASGQSNMEMPLRGFDTQPIRDAGRTIAYSGNYPGIRVAMMPKAIAYEPQEDAQTSWKVSSPENAGEFSALAYHFAKTLTDLKHVPVGIICNAYGGSSVEGWLPKEILDTYPGYNMAAEQKDSKKDDWTRIGVMYNALLKPVAGYTVRGFLWNQGESNVGRHQELPGHLSDMVKEWRRLWNDPQLPFYHVELPPWNYGDPQATDAALFREAQHKATEVIPESWIICNSDLIDEDELNDIHASRKPELGERLAFTVAATAYGMDGVPYRSTRFKKMTTEGDKAILEFDSQWDSFTPNEELPGFEAAGPDRVFHPAKAVQDWNTRKVTVTSEEVPEITAVRYNFRNFAPGKVHNLMGLPLIPFRTDNWEK